jgi:galactokinase
VVTENARVLSAVAAAEAGNAVAFGTCMNESHESLRHDYEVSSAALDAIVEAARRAPGVFGARMTGAGFGGCAVALVDEARADDFASAVTAGYRAAMGLEPTIYVCRPAAGAELRLLS